MDNRKIHTEILSVFAEAKLPFSPQAVSEDDQAYLTRLAYAISEWPKLLWDKLSEPAQEWFNSAAQAIDSGEGIPDEMLCREAAPVVKGAERAKEMFDIPTEQPAEVAEEQASAPVTEEPTQPKAPRPTQGRRRGRPSAKKEVSATAFAYGVALTNPDLTISGITEAMQNAVLTPLGPSTLNGILYSVRTCLKILDAQGRLKS